MPLANFADYSAELLAHIPELGNLLAGRLVNRGWQDIRDARLWSWQTFLGVFTAPNLIGQAYNVPSPSQGTVSVTQYGTTVNLSTAANTALNNLSNPLITQRQFRAGPTNGGVYNIIGYDPTAMTLTLDRIYQEPTASSIPYQVYRCYYTPTDSNGLYMTDFVAFESMVNPDLGYRISRSHLHTLRCEIDAMDPLRADQGLAYYVGMYTVDASGVPIYELWPHPTYFSGYVYIGHRRGKDFAAPTDSAPLTISSHMIVERALYYASEWAGKNIGRYPQLRGTNWAQQVTMHNATYAKMMIDAKKQDDEIRIATYIPSQAYDEMFLDEDMQVSTLLSTQSNAGWSGG